MNDFKEWLSDYLRYFLLFLAAALMVFLIIIGIRVYQAMNRTYEEDPVEVITEVLTENSMETETSGLIEAEETEAEEDVTETETQTVQMTESNLETETEVITEAETELVIEPVTEKATEKVTELVTEASAEPVTEPPVETEYVPVYKTLKGSCYIRSGPSMEAEIIGEYMYGTAVEFIEDVGGWYKVQIDGMTGYMGARFF